MTTQVLIINPQLAFTVALKQALERTGAFDVHPFTTADAAIEYLHDIPQDVALIQTTIPGVDAASLIHALRSVQPDLPIVISPRQPDALLQRLNVQGALDAPFNARDVIPLLNAAVAVRDSIQEVTPPPIAPPPGATQTLDDVDESFVVTTRFSDEDDEDAPPEESASFDDVLDSLNDSNIFDLDLDNLSPSDALSEDTPSRSRGGRNFDDLVRSMRADDARKPLHQRTQSLIDFTLPGKDDPSRPRDPSESTRLFHRLAEEEPPMPGLEDEGTVGDLMSGVVDSGFRDVLALLRGDEPTPVSSGQKPPSLSDDELQAVLDSFYESDDEEDEASPDPFRDFEAEPSGEEGRSTARVILETAFDESTPPEQFSVDELIASIERQLPEHRPNVSPLPSWLRDTQPLVAEPDFLPEEPSRVVPLDFTGDPYDQTTRPSSKQHIETRAGELETEDLEPVARTQPTDMPDFPSTPAFEEEDAVSEEEWQALFADVEPVPEVAEPLIEDVPEEPEEDEAPFYEAVPQDEAPVVDEPTLAHQPLDVIPTDVEAPLEPLLMEKFTGAWDDSGSVDVVETEDEAWEEAPEDWDQQAVAELATLDGQDDDAFVFDTGEAEPALEPDDSDVWAELSDLEAEAEPEESAFAAWDEAEAVDADELTWDEVEAAEAGVSAWDEAEAVEPAPQDSGEVWPEEDALEAPGPWPALEAPEDVEDTSERDSAWAAYIEALPEPQPEAPVVWKGERLPELPTMELPEFDTALFDTSFNQLADFDFPDAEILQFQPQLGARPVDDPRIAQLALSLVHASLESTAEATLLTRHGDIVGFAGELTREDLEQLQRAVSQWDGDIEQAHVGFVTMASNSRVVMVYTCRTEGELALSMVFAGSTPLRDIRRQGKRLVEALESVPEPEAALASLAPIVELQRAQVLEEPADIGPLVAQGALWVLADPNALLDDELAEALMVGLNTQLTEAHWQVHAVEAHEEYVYVYADMPAERSQAELIDELKLRAATILAAVDPAIPATGLWSEGYMVVSPGRLLEMIEIQDYVNFERM